MATKIQDITVITGEYTNKEGEKKKEYTRIGKFLTKEDGKTSIKIDTIPLQRDGRANIYDRKSKSGTETLPNDDTKDDLPF